MPRKPLRLLDSGHPGDTAIAMTGGATVPLSRVAVGAAVVSLDRHGYAFIGRSQPCVVVQAVEQRPHQGHLVHVSAGGREVPCASGHRWLVRFQRDVAVWVVYLMRRGRFYRVGWCQLFGTTGTNHLTHRARLEGADAAWILSVHRAKADASLEESFVAARWGLALPMFNEQAFGGNTIYTKPNLDRFHVRLHDVVDIKARALDCLAHHGRMHEFPFTTCSDYTRRGRTTCCVLEATNLIDGLMEIPVYHGQHNAVWKPLRARRVETPPSTVWALQVERHGLYVANGLLTCGVNTEKHSPTESPSGRRYRSYDHRSTV